MARDPELKDVVVDKISHYNFIDVDELESGRTSYYYTVYAQDIDGGEWNSIGVNYRFTTSQYGDLDKLQFDVNKEAAEEALPGMREGEAAGLYKPGSIENLKGILEKADVMQKWVTDRDGTQAEVNGVAEAIKEAISEKNINSGYVGSERMVTDLDNWVISKNADRTWLESKDNVLTYTNLGEGAEGGSTSIIYKDKQFIMGSKNTVFKTQMKFDLSQGWTGVALRAVVHDEPQLIYRGSNPCYFFAIKPNMIEFQKNPGGIMREIPNTFIKNGEWHDIEFGVLNTNGKTVVIFNVDGQKVLEYYDDYLKARTEEGALQFYIPPERSISIKPSEDMSKEFIYDGYMEEEKTADELIFKMNSNKALVGRETVELSGQTAVIHDGVHYLPLRISAEKSGTRVDWNKEGYAELLGKNGSIKVFPGENAFYINDTKKQPKHPIIIKNGSMKMSAEDLAEILELEYKFPSADVAVIGRNLGGDEELKAMAELLN